MNSATLLKHLPLALITMLLAAPAFGYDLRIHDAPNWVNDGTIYTTVQGERYFYGVGSSPVVGDPALQKAISKSRATSEAKRILTGWLELLSSDYAKAMHIDETALQSQIKQLKAAILEQAEIAARWRDPRTGSLYSLALLDITTVKRIVGENQQIDAALKNFIQQRGNRAFDNIKRSSKKRPHRPQ